METLKNLISPLSIAPMVDWTYMHFRVLMRLIAPHALLYTEMQPIAAILVNSKQGLDFQPMEYPLALQLGGADKYGLVNCAKIAEERGFAEINLNLGCPSDKVQAGRFGACLMKEADHVADCVAHIKAAVTIPITIKTRIGIDDHDSYKFFSSFAHKLVNAGCDKLIIHARKAWLRGLSPKQNRTIPPIHYDYVYRIKKEIPQIPVVVNGNINSLHEIDRHLQKVDGVMLGRIVCQNPYALMTIHHYFYPNTVLRSRAAILGEYVNYAKEQLSKGSNLSLLLKPILNFAHGLPDGKYWKNLLIQSQQKLEKLEEAVGVMAKMEQ